MGLAVQSLVPSTAQHTVLYKSCHLSPPTWIQCLLGPKSERAAGRELTLSSAIIALLSHAGLAGLVIGGGGGGWQRMQCLHNSGPSAPASSLRLNPACLPSCSVELGSAFLPLPTHLHLPFTQETKPETKERGAGPCQSVRHASR